MPADALDPFWTALLTPASVHQWQFGTDVVLTYGPFGFCPPTCSIRGPTRLLGLGSSPPARSRRRRRVLKGLRRIDPVVISILIFVGLRIAIVTRDTINGHSFNDGV